MLDPRPAVEIDVLFDLTASFAAGRFVDREFDPTPSTLDDLGHQRRILRRDIFVVEGYKLLKTEHTAIELDPLVHAPFFDVSDDMVDGKQSG